MQRIAESEVSPGINGTKSRKIVVIGCAVLLGFAVLTVLYYLKGNEALVDFRVFYTAGERFIEGQPLYNDADGHYQFKYFPASALIFMPFAAFPVKIAGYLWLVTMCLSLVAVVAVSRKMISERQSVRLWAVIVTVAVMARFMLRELELGQANAVFCALLVLAVWALAKSKQVFSGILVGLAIILKPYALIFLPYLLIKRSYRVLLITALAVVIASVIPVLRYGFGGNASLLNSWVGLLAGSTPALLTNADNISLFGAVAKWIGPEPVSRVVIFAALPTFILCAWLITHILRSEKTVGAHRERSDSLVMEWFIILLLIPLFSPQGWDYVFLTATPIVLLLLANWKHLIGWLKPPLAISLAVIGLSYFDLMGRELHSSFMRASVLTVCFVVVACVSMTLKPGTAGATAN